MEIRFQGKVKDTDQSDTENAVPQGMAGNGNTIYLLKTRKSKDTKVTADRDYIIKILKANTSSPTVVLPDNAIGAGHGNGMTYYNGYLYIASGGDYDAIYRVQETNNSTTSSDPSTEWTNGKGTAHYKKEKMTVNGINSDEDIRNIAHYKGNYFIVCLKRKYEDSTQTHTLTYGVFELNDTTFTVRKRFTVVKENTYKAIQDIDYKDGYLWIVLHETDGTKNHVILAEIPSSFSEIEDGQTYNVKKTVSIDKNEAGRSDTRNELESVYVNGTNIYTWSNISTGWYETFCRYSRFPDGVTISGVTAKSKTSLEVKWNAASNVESYRIDRRQENSDDYITITTLDSSKTSYTDTGLTAGTKYYYRVYGVNSGGTSPRKNGVQGITRTTTPKVSSVTTVSESSLRISWGGVTGAKKYIVCRKKEGAGEGWENYSRIAETTNTEFQDSGLEPNTKYYYGIIAVTETGVESGNPNENGNPGEENRGFGTTLGKYALDLNRLLDGQEHWELAGCGTADIYIDGKLDADDVSDYWKEWPEGTRYEVKDIKAKTNYRYEGIRGGSLSGTVGKGNVDLRLIFTTHMVVTGVKLNKSSLELRAGESELLIAAVEPSNAENQNVSWNSSKTSVATVDSSGRVTALKAGEASITVQTADGNKKSSCMVTVIEKEGSEAGTEPNPDPESGSAGTVSMASVNGAAGTTVAVPVMITENAGIIGLNLNMSYDKSKIRLVKVDSGSILDRSSMSGDYTKNPYKLSFSNETSSENIEDTGMLATAYFEILPDAGGEFAEITLTFEEAYDKDLNEVTFETVNGRISIQGFKPGDVNRDGQVKLNDAILLRRYVAGWDVEIDQQAADVNHDGQVKLNDAILLRRYVGGWDVELK